MEINIWIYTSDFPSQSLVVRFCNVLLLIQVHFFSHEFRPLLLSPVLPQSYILIPSLCRCSTVEHTCYRNCHGLFVKWPFTGYIVTFVSSWHFSCVCVCRVYKHVCTCVYGVQVCTYTCPGCVHMCIMSWCMYVCTCPWCVCAYVHDVCAYAYCVCVCVCMCAHVCIG